MSDVYFGGISTKLDDLRNKAALNGTGVIKVSIEELNEVDDQVNAHVKKLEKFANAISIDELMKK